MLPLLPVPQVNRSAPSPAAPGINAAPDLGNRRPRTALRRRRSARAWLPLLGKRDNGTLAFGDRGIWTWLSRRTSNLPADLSAFLRSLGPLSLFSFQTSCIGNCCSPFGGDATETRSSAPTNGKCPAHIPPTPEASASGSFGPPDRRSSLLPFLTLPAGNQLPTRYKAHQLQFCRNDPDHRPTYRGRSRPVRRVTTTPDDRGPLDPRAYDDDRSRPSARRFTGRASLGVPGRPVDQVSAGALGR